MYDLTMLEDAGVNTAEFVRCNHRFLQLQWDFLEDLLAFAEGCGAKGVEFDVDSFLLHTMQGLLEYVDLIVRERRMEDESNE